MACAISGKLDEKYAANATAMAGEEAVGRAFIAEQRSGH